MMTTLTLNGKKLQASPGDNLFDLAQSAFIAVPSSCKKQGKCKECVVEIRSGEELLSAKTPEEKHLNHAYRLSCRTVIEKPGTLEVTTLKRADIRIQDKGTVRLKDELTDPAVTKEGATVFLDGSPIDETDGAILGLTLDIGTTTVVARLIDIEKATVISSASFENPQRYAGTNVMSRIAYDTEVGKKELKRVFTEHLSDIITSLTDRPENIYEVVVGGNTTMRDLFFGLDVYSIGQKPYQSVTEKMLQNGEKASTSLAATGKKMRLPVHSGARIYGLPVIGGHVGADTAAALLAIDLMEEDRTVVLMDIGTNTEILIGNKNRVLAASSPSGPSFEGGGISCGMPALTGAVETVKIENDQPVYQTIGNAEPTGICGSGLIDLMSELLRVDKINMLGRFEDEADRYYLNKERNVFIDENDINLLAQAKGANVAALKILFKRYGIRPDEIDVFYLAGGFGNHIDIEACIRIGLLPDLPVDRFKKIGNAAIEGLSDVLLSKTKREQLEEFVKSVEQVNLESDPDFFDHFVDGCMFGKIV